MDQLLLNKGIIAQSGDICQDIINHISGTVTAPLFEALFTFSGNDVGTMDRISAIFTHLYNEGLEVEMLAVLRILYDVAGNMPHRRILRALWRRGKAYRHSFQRRITNSSTRSSSPAHALMNMNQPSTG